MLYYVILACCDVSPFQIVPDCLAQDGNDIFDLGEALYSFLLRFGDEFDIRRVSSSSSGGNSSNGDSSNLQALVPASAATLDMSTCSLEHPATAGVSRGVRMCFSRGAAAL